MQAITTRYLPPTNTLGSRIVAQADAGRKVYHWDYQKDASENHRNAAILFAKNMGWLERSSLVSGTNHHQEGVHVLIPNKLLAA